jgi:hypothetical protein
VYLSLKQQRLCILLLAVFAFVCGWNPQSAAIPYSVSAPSTIRSGETMQAEGGGATSVLHLQSRHFSKHVHNLSPAMLPVGVKQSALTRVRLSYGVQTDADLASAGCSDHSRAPPALS